MPPKELEYPKKNIDLYDRLMASRPHIKRKGKAVPYTSVNGHMFTCMNKVGQVGIRLSKEEQQAFLDKYCATLFMSYGAVMRGYVAVPEDLLQRTDELAEYLDKSFEYVSSLEPKPTKEK